MYQRRPRRTVDPGGQAYFLNLLDHGTPTFRQVVATIVYSTEPLRTTVNGYYQHFLDTSAETAGRELPGSSQLQRGARDELIIALIIGSDEYFSIT